MTGMKTTASRRRRVLLPAAMGIAATALLAAPAAALQIDWVTVGDPENAADLDTGFGAVSEVYRISKTEITNAQYAEFLNAVAARDTKELYNPFMGATATGGITRSGSPGSFTYSTKPGREDKPVNNVSFYDAIRLANWLHNGQPTGGRGAASTEHGAYTITPAGIRDDSIERNGRATVFLPSEDEWYKAAYYDPVSASFFDYPASSDVQTGCGAPGPALNTANCGNLLPDLTDVGSYTGSASPNGTFDQGGNVWEWTEGTSRFGTRVLRGGGLSNDPITLAASFRGDSGPRGEGRMIGFRLASPIPEPGTALLVMSGVVCLTGWRSVLDGGVSRRPNEPSRGPARRGRRWRREAPGAGAPRRCRHAPTRAPEHPRSRVSPHPA